MAPSPSRCCGSLKEKTLSLSIYRECAHQSVFIMLCRASTSLGGVNLLAGHSCPTIQRVASSRFGATTIISMRSAISCTSVLMCKF